MAEETREEEANVGQDKTEEVEPKAAGAGEAEPEGHHLTVSMVDPPAEVNAGSSVALQSRVSCASRCDLRGKVVRIIAQDAVVVQEIYLTQFYGINETDVIIVKAPTEPGEYTWTALFPAQEKGGVVHQESSAPFSFVVMPHHATSLAVWDVPSAIPAGERFTMKVGVKCSADCELADKQIEIYDHEGGRVATKKLGDAPWAGTGTLYWTEVQLESPGTEGYYRWTAKFPEPDLELPHGEASHTFGFTTVGPPEHVVTVEVTHKDTKAPIKNADVLLHPYRGRTDESGMATLVVPKGEYELYVSKNKFETFQTTVKAASDVAVKAELLLAPVPDDDG
jgi:hypothetical protein